MVWKGNSQGRIAEIELAFQTQLEILWVAFPTWFSWLSNEIWFFSATFLGIGQ